MALMRNVAQKLISNQGVAGKPQAGGMLLDAENAPAQTTMAATSVASPGTPGPIGAESPATTPPPPSIPPSTGTTTPVTSPGTPGPIGTEPPPGAPTPVTSPGTPGPIGVEPTPGAPVPGAPPATAGPTQGYTPTTWTPTTRTVDERTETVAGQLERILGSNSPLLERARAQANERMNARGMLNTSLASTAALDAVLGQALNIANPDAQAYQSAARENVAMQNQAGQFNAAQGTDASRFMAAGDLQMQQQRLGAQLDLASRERLAAIEQNYRSLTNSSLAANSIVQDLHQRIGSIMQDPAMSPENKALMVQRMIDATRGSLAMLGAINNVNFGNLLNFATTAAPGAAAPVLSAPIPAGGPSVAGANPTTPPPTPRSYWVPGVGWQEPVESGGGN